MRQLGLIGKTLSHSFSKIYFEDKFRNENKTNCSYELLELPSKVEVESFLRTGLFNGLNVTIPYKKVVIPILDKLSPFTLSSKRWR